MSLAHHTLPPANPADFDFLHGSWHIRHRRLRERLRDSNDWLEFTGTATVVPLPAGLGNREEVRFDFGEGEIVGLAWRIFEPACDRWSIYWADSRRRRVDPPMSGRFDGDTAIFLGDDEHLGRPVRVRFEWSRAVASAPRWSQAFSADGGATWEVNWIMDFAPRTESRR